MHDDIKLLISYISKNKMLEKVAISINHDKHSDFFTEYEYIYEPAVLKTYMSLLPSSIADDLDYIVHVEDIRGIIIEDPNKS